VKAIIPATLIYRSVMVLLVIAGILTACARSRVVDMHSLEKVEQPQKLDEFTPTWDNQETDEHLDIRVYLEPYQQAKFMQDSLSFLATKTNGRVRIYDYLPHADVESFMVSGIGQCIADQQPELYLEYLNRIVDTNNLVDELVMAALARDILGKNYDRRCLQSKIKALKVLFENDNPLQFSKLPATVINGYLIYGDLTLEQWEYLVENLR